MNNETDLAGPRANRRAFLRSAAAGSAIALGGAVAHANETRSARPEFGLENQRRTDPGNGRFQNPIIAGDHADPTVLKDGEDYYLTCSSLEYYPGIVIWHSRDLVNWTPIATALTRYIGSVWAMDLVKHKGRYYIYIPAVGVQFGRDGMTPRAGLPMFSIYVIHADDIRGPWSDPIDLKIGGFDPGHVVGEDGKRYLFIMDGHRIPLSDDGLSTTGKPEKVYHGWPIPKDWVIEAFALEGPKFLRKDGWFYMFTAEGGTAGPPTSHMVIVARARSIDGPWENCPHNPIVRTSSRDEPWWSRGHATPIEGPGGDWWMIYHGYENGLRTLGRQVLLEPMAWDADGWPHAKGGDLGSSLAAPLRTARTMAFGQRLSDDLSRPQLGSHLAYFAPQDNDYLARAHFGENELVLQARGKMAGDSSPLAFIPVDPVYSVDVEVMLDGDVEAGLLLFYSDPGYYCGLGFRADRGVYYRWGRAGLEKGPEPLGSRFHLRVINDREVASFYYSRNGRDWTLYGSLDVADYNHNAAHNFLSLRPAIYAAGSGRARFRNLNYRAGG